MSTPANPVNQQGYFPEGKMAQLATVSIHLLTVNLHALIRDAVCALLAYQPYIEVLPQTPTCDTALSFALNDQPDLLLFNLDDCHHQHLECLANLRAYAPAARILVLSNEHDITRFRAAIGRGVHGILMKTEDSGMLFNAIQQTSQGRVWLDYKILSQLIPDIWFARRSYQSEAEATQLYMLTAREREVVALHCEGLKYHEIAKRLGNSIATVRSQTASAILKLGLHDRSELISYVYRNSLAPLSFQKVINPVEEKEMDRKMERKGTGTKLHLTHRKLA